MARAACKIIINGQLLALIKSLETVLTSPLVRDEMMPATECDTLIQKLADLDIHTYTGQGSPAALCDIVGELVTAGVLTNEVYEILRHPDNPAVPSS